MSEGYGGLSGPSDKLPEEQADEHAALKEDRDLWKQSEASCSAQYDKLQAENAAQAATIAELREGLRRAIAELEKSDRRRCKSLGKLRALIGKTEKTDG